MDSVDFKILNMLCKDARIPFRKIAEKLEISTETVVRRFKKLQDARIILGSTVVLSSEACGFKELLGLFIKNESSIDTKKVKDKLMKIPQVNSVWQEWGAYDFYVEAFLRDLSEMHDLIDAIRKIDGIVTISPMIYTQRNWPIPCLIYPCDICQYMFPKETKNMSPTQLLPDSRL